jgi:hypothetical protein
MIFLKTGRMENLIDYGYSYNYLFCYTGSLGLFSAFGCIKPTALERIRKPIELLSGSAFGVYLIHEHINFRYLWQTWFDTESARNASVPVFIINMLMTVAAVYLVCSLIEILRAKAGIYINRLLKGRDA